MSRWRREAAERLPELQKTIASPDVKNPMMLWIELNLEFEGLCEKDSPPLDLLGRIWRYANWCLAQKDENLSTAAATGFCEHLIDNPARMRILPEIMKRRDYLACRELLLYHNSEEKYQKGLQAFATK